MSTKEATITSKNQLTIPADIVRKYGLDKTRVVELHGKEKGILLTPKQSAADIMKKHWNRHRAKRPLSEEELDEATRRAMADKAL